MKNFHDTHHYMLSLNVGTKYNNEVTVRICTVNDWISSKCIFPVFNSKFNCLSSAKESHCLTEHLSVKLLRFIKNL